MQEETLLSRITEMEKAHDKLSRRESLLMAREDALKQKDLELKEFDLQIKQQRSLVAKDKSELEQLRDRLARAKDIKKDLPKLEKRWADLHSNVQDAEAKLMKYGLEPLAKREMLKDIEGQIRSRQKELEYQQRSLSMKEMEIAEEAMKLKDAQDEALHNYMEHETKEPYQLDAPRPAETNNPQLYHLLEQARDALHGGRVHDAIRLAVQIESLSEGLPIVDKRAIMLDVMSLKTDIKLASLS